MRYGQVEPPSIITLTKPCVPAAAYLTVVEILFSASKVPNLKYNNID